MNNETIQQIIEPRFDELNERILRERNTTYDHDTLAKLHIRRDEILMLASQLGCSMALNRKVWVESGVFLHGKVE